MRESRGRSGGPLRSWGERSAGVEALERELAEVERTLEEARRWDFDPRSPGPTGEPEPLDDLIAAQKKLSSGGGKDYGQVPRLGWKLGPPRSSQPQPESPHVARILKMMAEATRRRDEIRDELKKLSIEKEKV